VKFTAQSLHFRVISSFPRGVHEIFILLGCYVQLIGT